MRSSNPILSRDDAFTPASQFGGAPRGGLMTVDDVITKTAVSLAVLIAAAGAMFLLMPPQLVMPIGIGSALAAFVASLVVAFRRTVSPALVLAFAALEGLFVGAISRMFEGLYDGIVVQAIFATFIAAAATLGAYKFFNIRVTPRFRQVVTIATVGFVVLMLVNLGLSFAGINLGLRDGGTGGISLLAVGVSLFALVLGVLNLVLDFDYVEQGVRMGAPASQSWKAAFGLTATLVWLYIEMLRMLSYLRR
ncbi:Bax inhibitor-1/YccA family protein [Mariniluteicoccus flavus]